MNTHGNGVRDLGLSGSALLICVGHGRTRVDLSLLASSIRLTYQ
jgi:hypothetical protein